MALARAARLAARTSMVEVLHGVLQLFGGNCVVLHTQENLTGPHELLLSASSRAWYSG